MPAGVGSGFSNQPIPEKFLPPTAVLCDLDVQIECCYVPPGLSLGLPNELNIGLEGTRLIALVSQALQRST